LAKNDGVKTSP